MRLGCMQGEAVVWQGVRVSAAGCPTAVCPYLPVCARSLGPRELCFTLPIPTLFPGSQTVWLGISSGKACQEGLLARETGVFGLKGGCLGLDRAKTGGSSTQWPRIFRDSQRNSPSIGKRRGNFWCKFGDAALGAQVMERRPL